MLLNIVIEEDDEGFYAFCPALRGCHTQGDTLDEVLRNIREVTELYLDTLSPEERVRCASKQILTTTVEAHVAQA